MKKIDKLHPSEVPGRCMFYPQVISDEEGFYIGMDLDGLTPGTMRACIAVKSVKEIARREGMLEPADLEALSQQVEDLEIRLRQSEASLAEAERELDAIAGLTKGDFVVHKPQGRPPKKVKETA